MSEGQRPVWEPPLLETKVSEKSPFVGQTIRYTLRVGHPPDVSVKLPTGLSLDPYTLNGVRHTTEAAAGKGGLVVERFDLDLGVYTLDGGVIPPITLDVETPKGPAQLAVAGPKITVRSVTEGKPAEPKALAPPVAVKVTDTALLRAAGVGLLVLVLTLALWRLYRRLRDRRARRPAPVVPPRPLEERTLEALDALQRKGLVAAGKHRLYFFELSEIVRGYLGERFGFEALECTTAELLARMRDRPTPGLEHQRFEAWCELGDLVKFARYVPSDAECSDALTYAVELVRKTSAAHREAAPPPSAKEAAA